MSLGSFARLSFTVFAVLSLAGRASAQLIVQTSEIEGAQQRIDFANNQNPVPIPETRPFMGTLPLPAPPPLINFDASHAGGWFLEYGASCPTASTIWPNSSGSEFGLTSVTASWDDDFVITAPGKAGLGWLDIRLRFGGELSADGSSSRSGYGVELSLVGEDFLFEEWFGECLGLSGPNVCTGGDLIGDPLTTYPMPGEDPLRVQFQFGQPIFIDIRLDATGEAQQSERGEASAAPTLRWLGIAQVLDAGMAPVASYDVVSTSGFDYSQAAGDCEAVEPSMHDLALGVKPPKRVKLGANPIVTSTKVSIHNRGGHDETIPDQNALEDLVSFTVESLGACPVPTGMLLPPKKGFPVVLRPNSKLSLTLALTIGCANDPAASGKGEDHSDYRLSMDVDHSALGAPDAVPANDHCPRAPSGGDKGCGGKFGGDLLVDVFVP